MTQDQTIKRALKILERRIRDAPTLASPEAVRNGHTGILTRPGQPHLLAQAIRRISSPATDRVAMARNARALIEKDYDVRQQAETLRALSMEARRVA